MSLFRRGQIWWYHFMFAGRHIQESTKTKKKTLAKMAEEKRRRELEEGFNAVQDRRKDRIQTVKQTAEDYLNKYQIKHPASTPRYMKYVIQHLTKHLGNRMLIDITEKEIEEYQLARLKEGGPASALMRK
ncbi:MAG TPA: hypothetical protein VMW38_14435 [Terriglobia bacterium]|nr:hypothetical protein [Terriglobia bacterium]